MAEKTAKTTPTGSSQPGAVLRPGRPADRTRPESARAPVETPDRELEPLSGPSEHPEPASAETWADATESGAEDQAAPSEGSEETERRYAESRQRRWRRLLRQCDRVNLMDFHLLSLSDWPDSFSLNEARRRRDVWLLSATIAALVFLSGLTGLVPAWVAGGGFGAFVVILLLGVPFIRRLYSSKPSYFELILRRQQLIRDARRHIAHLEGDVGLIWQCNELAEFNPALASPRFSTLRHLSEQRRLASALSKREHIRLYLIFMLEAEKAYRRLQTAYFEQHQKAIDRGWASVAEAVTETGGGGGEASGAGVIYDQPPDENGTSGPEQQPSVGSGRQARS
ncbi:hypothetical protein SAMN05216203_0893 [Marinobacter daqiaonensis]|uniref:Uncharacterized protein n=1 Tax=Marinobacter daqiaonensis TaxID=650891 RepID=A0A1I6H542_9GAMM|nr:hypothetical protein [Marinobacter daqiaonensis]SFR49573.1 hypothetical protein SAMN05216203_0893 [Marinobacter daqiaonensis]